MTTFQSRWKSLPLRVLLLILGILLLASQVFAAPSCKKIKGTFTFEPLTGAACSSAVSMCLSVDVSGSLAGTSVFTASSLIPSSDTPATSVVFVTGDSTLNTGGGTLLIKDAMSLATSGNGEFSQTSTLLGATGSWAGYSGRFTATGTMLQGTGSGKYSGLFCAP